MPEEIKDLIEKIQKEGIQAAQAKAEEIESLAKDKAASLIEQAKVSAGKIIAEARNEAAKINDTTSVALQQAARDMLISVKKEISDMLNNLIISKLNTALTPEELSKIILAAVKGYSLGAGGEIVLQVSKEDLKKMESFLGELKEQAKKNIQIKASDGIASGFIISFDSGRSQFDFSDKALAEYIGSYLKPKLNDLLRQAIP